jgi:hypothetical protein
MKILLTISTLVFTLMFSSTSFAEWFEVTRSERGDTLYLDMDRIRQHDGYFYYWDLTDYLRPTEYGYLSISSYNQGDCKLFRSKVLSVIMHKQPMGRDVGDSQSLKNPEWYNPGRGSVEKNLLSLLCFLFQ